jgi:hypothetical protein
MEDRKRKQLNIKILAINNKQPNFVTPALKLKISRAKI